MSLDRPQHEQILRRREDHDDTDAEGSWAISYGDMITLLLTFFILYFNLNAKNGEKKTHLQQEILTEFGEQKKEFDAKPSSSTPRMSLSEEQKGELENRVIEDWGGTLIREGEKIIVDFKNTTFFDLGKEDVKASSRKYLETFARKYVKFAGSHMLNVKAYTDTVPVKTGHRYRDNLELSALRSISAMRILQRAGIPLGRMKLVGLGETISNRIPASVEEEQKMTGGKPSRKGDQFARKVLLVIEPFTKEKL
jgi:chemotaxis protein MotB